MTEALCSVWLSTSLKLNPRAIERTLQKFTPKGAYNATKEELEGAGLDLGIVEKLADKELIRAERIVERCESLGISIVTSDSPAYPERLSRLRDKPYILYVRGDITCLSGRKTAALVGTRKMTERGRSWSERIAGELIDGGYILVSGAAEGVDSVAARESISRGVPTVAVLGVDIDKYFPKINTRLIDKIAECGAVVSEYPPFTDARYFAQRNRIIVGLSDELAVTEAPVTSGALIGARLALKLGIPVSAVGDGGEGFSGSRALIAEGARNLCGEKSSETPKETPKAEEKDDGVPKGLDGARAYIYKRLLEGEQNENSLVSEKYPIQSILCALTELELDGYIKALPGGKYSLK